MNTVEKIANVPQTQFKNQPQKKKYEGWRERKNAFVVEASIGMAMAWKKKRKEKTQTTIMIKGNILEHVERKESSAHSESAVELGLLHNAAG